jgi:hypothetical protein
MHHCWWFYMSTHILLNSHGWNQPSISFHPTALSESRAGQNSRDSKRVATWPSLLVVWAAPECPIFTWPGCVLKATSRGLRGTYTHTHAHVYIFMPYCQLNMFLICVSVYVFKNLNRDVRYVHVSGVLLVLRAGANSLVPLAKQLRAA